MFFLVVLNRVGALEIKRAQPQPLSYTAQSNCVFGVKLNVWLLVSVPFCCTLVLRVPMFNFIRYLFPSSVLSPSVRHFPHY